MWGLSGEVFVGQVMAATGLLAALRLLQALERFPADVPQWDKTGDKNPHTLWNGQPFICLKNSTVTLIKLPRLIVNCLELRRRGDVKITYFCVEVLIFIFLKALILPKQKGTKTHRPVTAWLHKKV